MGYKVTWEIDFEDEVSSPEEAAKLALEYIVNGTARVFNVETLDTGGKRMNGEWVDACSIDWEDVPC